MSLHTLSYWIDVKREIPNLINYVKKEPIFEIGYFLSLDICKPIHRVLEIDNQSLKKSWESTNFYIESALKIVSNVYKEEHLFNRNAVNIDKELVFEIKEQLGQPPTHCYPIYLVTVGNGNEERIVYIGKTSSNNNRFIGGHRVALKLHEPKYFNLEKKVYFGCIMLLDENKDYLPLEWIQPIDKALRILDNIESGLIYYYSPELNTQKTKKNYSKINVNLHIQNFTNVTNFLNDEHVWI